MKNRHIIIALIAVGLAAATSAQTAIGVQEAKSAQRAAYAWLKDYNIAMKFDSKWAKQNYLKLCEDGSTSVHHDYLPAQGYPFGNPNIDASSYIATRTDAGRRYNIAHKIGNSRIVGMEKSGRKVRIELEWDEAISYLPTDATNPYTYPSMEFRMRGTLLYDHAAQEIAAERIEAVGEPVAPFVMLHTPSGNEQSTIEKIEQARTIRPSALTMTNISQCDFDEKYYDYRIDTLRNAATLSLGMGFASPRTEFAHAADIELTDASLRDIYLGVGYYRQLMLSGKNRLGVEAGAELTSRRYNWELKYNAAFADIDPYGDPYERRVNTTGYTERMQQTGIGVPIGLRYDYFIDEQQWSVHAHAGVVPTLAIVGSVQAQAESMHIEGYYKWLYEVVMDAEGIYDFGTHEGCEWEGRNRSFGNFSLDGVVGIGATYWHAASGLSASLSVDYRPQLVQSVQPTEGYHLSTTTTSWTSITEDVSSTHHNNICIKLQINYNF